MPDYLFKPVFGEEFDGGVEGFFVDVWRAVAVCVVAGFLDVVAGGLLIGFGEGDLG